MNEEQEQTQQGETFYTVKDIAECLQVSHPTVIGLLRKHNVPVVRLGRRMKIREHDVDALLSKVVNQPA